MPQLDPALWVGFRTTRGVEYVGRPTSATLRAVTHGNQWYLRAGKDRDGVVLFRRPRRYEEIWRWLRTGQVPGQQDWSDRNEN